MSYPTCQNYRLLSRNLGSGWKASYNDSNLSVCKLPTSTVFSWLTFRCTISYKLDNNVTCSYDFISFLITSMLLSAKPTYTLENQWPHFQVDFHANVGKCNNGREYDSAAYCAQLCHFSRLHFSNPFHTVSFILKCFQLALVINSTQTTCAGESQPHSSSTQLHADASCIRVVSGGMEGGLKASEKEDTGRLCTHIHTGCCASVWKTFLFLKRGRD